MESITENSPVSLSQDEIASPKKCFLKLLASGGDKWVFKCYFGGIRLFLSLKMIFPWPPREDKFLFLGAAESFETWLAEAVTLMPLWRSLSLGWKTPCSNNFDSLNPVETCSPCWTAPFISGSCNLNKETPTQVFSCEYCKIFKSNYLKEHLRTAASKRCFENFCKICAKTTGPEPLFNKAAALRRSLMNQCQCWITPKTDLLYPN